MREQMLDEDFIKDMARHLDERNREVKNMDGKLCLCCKGSRRLQEKGRIVCFDCGVEMDLTRKEDRKK